MTFGSAPGLLLAVSSGIFESAQENIWVPGIKNWIVHLKDKDPPTVLLVWVKNYIFSSWRVKYFT